MTALYQFKSSEYCAQQTCPTLGFPMTSSVSPKLEYTAISWSIIFAKPSSGSTICNWMESNSFTDIKYTSRLAPTSSFCHFNPGCSPKKSSWMSHDFAYPKSTRLWLICFPLSSFKITSIISPNTCVISATNVLEQQRDSNAIEHSGDHWPSSELGFTFAKLLSTTKTGIFTNSSLSNFKAEIGIFSLVPQSTSFTVAVSSAEVLITSPLNHLSEKGTQHNIPTTGFSSVSSFSSRAWYIDVISLVIWSRSSILSVNSSCISAGRNAETKLTGTLLPNCRSGNVKVFLSSVASSFCGEECSNILSSNRDVSPRHSLTICSLRDSDSPGLNSFTV